MHFLTFKKDLWFRSFCKRLDKVRGVSSDESSERILRKSTKNKGLKRPFPFLFSDMHFRYILWHFENQADYLLIDIIGYNLSVIWVCRGNN